VYQALAGTIALFTGNVVGNIIGAIFGPILLMPGQGFLGIPALFAGGNIINGIFLMIWLILPPLLAAVVCGKVAEKHGAAFGAMVLTGIIMAVIAMVFAVFVPGYWVFPPGITDFTPFYLLIGTAAYVVVILIMGFINGLMWSGIAAAMAED
jgi:hypothetical protein